MPIEVIASARALTDPQWHQLTGRDYPFLQQAFFLALEESGATTAQSGWQPSHLVAYEDGQPVALLPLFIKTHSYGEYVFDWSWADAYRRIGHDYYPKLVTAIPFTPATGPRFCFAEHLTPAEREGLTGQLLARVQSLAAELHASSWHCLFPETEVAQQLAAQGFCLRQACQFHWFNHNFSNFDDFLATFNSRKRKNLKKERQKIPEQGITLRRVEGVELTPKDWHRFYDFYRLTYLKRSGHEGYLNEAFFQALGEKLADHLMMAQAFKEDRFVAAALFFKSSSHLYGRYWGALDEFDGLHFEACYYQGIEYAIEQGLACFDPGAQGEHKIQRGFTPTATWSNHWLADHRFHAAVVDFVTREVPHIEAYMAEAAQLLPFKQE
ncbi:GNAT family N-acetyltransferase [Halioxenophilus sp. WMMB6]|uniref:GNAT family N-acetyltransferase n=1 Tax=Halioxenophilus sp. WMMB6 TaxID=3073815 RepID=UPI00295F1FB6|nr:GNAT family N-acetyltransferase [Halioxenophilus sp. WMMB6]